MFTIGNSLRREVNFGNFERARDEGKFESRRGGPHEARRVAVFFATRESRGGPSQGGEYISLRRAVCEKKLPIIYPEEGVRMVIHVGHKVNYF